MPIVHNSKVQKIVQSALNSQNICNLVQLRCRQNMLHLYTSNVHLSILKYNLHSNFK